MQIIKVSGIVLAAALLLTGCTSYGPLTDAQADSALRAVEKPTALIAFELEDPDGVDGSESEGYTKSYDSSSICNAVAEIGQLTYQSGFELKNKQSLPTELRNFEVRKGIKYVAKFNDGDEYVTFYLTLISFDDEETAANFASRLKEAVVPCGDVSGDIQERTTIKFAELDGPNDFMHRAREAFSIYSVTVIGEAFDYLVQKGAVIALVHVGASEGGVSASGLATQEIDEISLDLIDQAFKGIEY